MDREIEIIKRDYEEKMKKNSKGKGKKDKSRDKGKDDESKSEDDEKAEKEKDAKVPFLIAPSDATLTYRFTRSKQSPPSSLRLSMKMFREYMHCKSTNIFHQI